jgi:hypothetical protein
VAQWHTRSMRPLRRRAARATDRGRLPPEHSATVPRSHDVVTTRWWHAGESAGSSQLLRRDPQTTDLGARQHGSAAVRRQRDLVRAGARRGLRGRLASTALGTRSPVPLHMDSPARRRSAAVARSSRETVVRSPYGSIRGCGAWTRPGFRVRSDAEAPCLAATLVPPNSRAGHVPAASHAQPRRPVSQAVPAVRPTRTAPASA